jgi:predicted kinase
MAMTGADAGGGSGARTLVILRGNSGSGKSSIARAVRSRYGRGCALIEQDYFRRIILRDHDGLDSTGIAPQLIARSAAFALANGYHVIVEGILHRARYHDALHGLIRDHAGPAFVYYLDIPFAETVRRHATRLLATEFTAADMRGWYHDHDVLGTPGEYVIDESSTLDESVDLILRTSCLTDVVPVTYCPTACPHCRDEAGR